MLGAVVVLAVGRRRCGDAGWLVAAAALSPRRPAGGPRPVPVEIAKAVKKAVPLRVEALGTVTPIASVAIKARLETVITEVHFQDGAEVKQGDLLFTLDGRQIEAEIKRVEAVIAGALAQLQQAERDVQRYTELVAKNATTVVTLNNAQTQVNMSRATAEVEQRHAGKSQGPARLHQDPRADPGSHQRRQREGRQFRAAERYRTAGDHHSDGPGLRDLHGAATDAARTCGRRSPPRARRSRPSSPASTQARAAARSP